MIKVYKEAEYKGDCSVLHVLHFVYCGVFFTVVYFPTRCSGPPPSAHT